jgi:hypothetical protein
VDFPEALAELEEALLATKTTFVIEKTINGIPRESQSHEVDHVRSFESGAMIALEIEWNNKDPFYDRDLENFKRLHADGAISVGIIVTRGKSLQSNMRELVRKFLDLRDLDKLDDLRNWGYDPTSKQRAFINKQTSRPSNPITFREAFTNKFSRPACASASWPTLGSNARAACCCSCFFQA